MDEVCDGADQRTSRHGLLENIAEIDARLVKIFRAVIKVLRINEESDTLAFLFYDSHTDLFDGKRFFKRSRFSLVALLKSFQVDAAAGDHLKKPPSGTVVLFVGFQMFGQFVDALRQNSNLHFRRASVFFMLFKFSDDIFLLF